MNVSQIVAKNVRCFAKQNNIKIGDIERRLNFRLGYFSRTEKKGSAISIDTVVKLTEILDFPIEKIIDGNYAESMEIERLEKEIAEKEEELKRLKKISGADVGECK